MILDLWIFFPRSKIQSVWPSSAVRWSDRRPSIAVDIPRGRRERVPRGRSYFSCFCATNDFLWYVSSWFEPRVVRCDLFVGLGFNSPAQLHVSRQVGSVAYVTRPHEWSIRWHRKQKNSLKRDKKLVCMGSGPECCGEVEGDRHV